MATVIFIDSDGNRHVIEAKDGHTLMAAGYARSVPGIIAECGGACACATCHVYIDSAWINKLPQPDAMECAMLDTVADRQISSRLSCQILLNSTLDGLTVQVADNQTL